MGKPTTYTKELGDSICMRITSGEKLGDICDEEGMPSRGTVYLWRGSNPAFDQQYLKAREGQAEAIFDDLLDIIDDGTNDWVERQTRNGSYIALNSEAVIRSKARVETRFRMLQHMNQQRYGNKAQIDHRSADGSMSPMTDEQRAARLTLLHNQAVARTSKGNVDDGSDLI